MKKLPFFLFVAALVVAVLFIPSKIASAEEVSFDYLTPNYYEFGYLSEVYEENGNIYVFEKSDADLYLRVVGKTEAKILVGANVDGVAYKLCAIDGIVYLNAGGSFIKRVDVSTGEIKDSVFPTVEKLDVLDFPFTAITVDPQNKVLFLSYQSIVRGYYLDKIESGASLEESRAGTWNVVNAYENMLVEKTYLGGVKLFFYNSTDGKIFTLDKRKYDEDDSVMQSSQSLYYQGGAYYAAFLSGAEKVENGVTVKNGDSDFTIEFGALADDKIQALGGMFGDDRLYVLDNGQNAIKVFSLGEDGLYLDEFFGSFGYGDGLNEKGLTRFNSPSLISASEKCVSVYDEGNARIVTIIDGITQPSKYVEGVEALCAAGSNGKYGVWYKKGDRIYSYDPATATSAAEYRLPNLQYIGFNGSVSAVADGKVYVFKNNAFEELFSAKGKVASGMHDGIYYAYDDGFTMYKDGAVIITVDTDISFESFSSDYKGNLWLKNGKKVYAYLRLPSSFEKSEYDLPAYFSDLCLTSLGKAYAVYENTIVSLSLPVASSLDEGTFEGEKYTENYKMFSSKGCWAYESLDNYESIIRLEEGAASVLFEKLEYLQGEYFRGEILRNGSYHRIYVASSDVELLENQTSEDLFVKYMGVDREPKGYEYPSKSASAITDIPRDVALEVVYTVGVEGDYWYAVVNDGKVCYVEKNNNYVVDVRPYEEIKRFYAYISLDRLGGSCSIYAYPDEDSEVLGLFTDGAKVETPEEIDYDEEFTRIRYNDGYAYVKTSYLQEKGLTVGQKFALIFGGVSLALVIVPLVLVAVIRKRRK